MQWKPPNHQEIGRVLSDDMEVMARRAREWLTTVDPKHLVLHVDCWDDTRLKRHFVGACVEWLTDDLEEWSVWVWAARQLIRKVTHPPKHMLFKQQNPIISYIA